MSNSIDNEEIFGEKYDYEENMLIAKWLQKGIKRDGRGRNPVRSGCSINNIQQDLDNMYDPVFYYDKKGHRRSHGAIGAQITRFSLDEDISKKFAVYESLSPIHRRVYQDIWNIKQELMNEGIHEFSIGDYTPISIDSPLIISDKLSQEQKDDLEKIKLKYPFIRMNIRTQTEFDEKCRRRYSALFK